FKRPVTSQIKGADAGRVALMAILVTAVMGLIGRVAAMPLGLNRVELSAFLLVVMFSNGGNYGLPVVLFAFGNEALSIGTVYFVVSAVLTYTIGVFLAATGKRTVWQAMAGLTKIPAIYSRVPPF